MTRALFVAVLGLVVVTGAMLLLLRDHGDDEPSREVTRTGGDDVREEARLAGAPDAVPAELYRDADVATTLSAFRFQPPNVPAAAVSRLRRLVDEDPDLLAHLVRVALDGEPLRADLVPADYPYEVRQAAQWAIEALGRPVARILAARLATETDRGMRQAIYWELSRLGAEAAPAVDVVVAQMRDRGLDARERGKAVFVLGAIGREAEAAVPDLLALLGDPDDDAFGYALQTIYPIAGMTDAVRDAFIDLLAIEDDDLRVEILDVIVQQVGEDARALRPTLVHLVGHDQPDVRRLALHALEPVGVEDPDALALVGRRHEEGDSDEEFAAKHVLLASGDAGSEVLFETFRITDDVGLAVRTGQTLVRAGGVEQLPTETLVRLFRECDRTALPSVVFLMNMLPDGVEAATGLPVLRAELLDPDGDRRAAAAEALSAIRGDDEAVIALAVRAFEDARVADFVIYALGRMARVASEVVPLLEAQATRGRLEAVDALGRLAREAPLARAALERLAASNEDPEVRADARQTLHEVDAVRSGP